MTLPFLQSNSGAAKESQRTKVKGKGQRRKAASLKSLQEKNKFLNGNHLSITMTKKPTVSAKYVWFCIKFRSVA
jgi:hypothetical protein